MRVNFFGRRGGFLICPERGSFFQIDSHKKKWKEFSQKIDWLKTQFSVSQFRFYSNCFHSRMSLREFDNDNARREAAEAILFTRAIDSLHANGEDDIIEYINDERVQNSLRALVSDYVHNWDSESECYGVPEEMLDYMNWNLLFKHYVLDTHCREHIVFLDAEWCDPDKHQLPHPNAGPLIGNWRWRDEAPQCKWYTEDDEKLWAMNAEYGHYLKRTYYLDFDGLEEAIRRDVRDVVKH